MPVLRPFVERLRMPFPWLALLSPSEQEVSAKEIVDIARGCAAVARHDQLLATLHAWLATAEALAAGYPGRRTAVAGCGRGRG